MIVLVCILQHTHLPDLQRAGKTVQRLLLRRSSATEKDHVRSAQHPDESLVPRILIEG